MQFRNAGAYAALLLFSRGALGAAINTTASATDDTCEPDATVTATILPSAVSGSASIAASPSDVPLPVNGTESNPGPSFNGTLGAAGAEQASGVPSASVVTQVVYSTNIHTVTSCAATITNCPASSTALSTEIVAVTQTTTLASGIPSGVPSGSAPGPSGVGSAIPSGSGIPALSSVEALTGAPSGSAIPSGPRPSGVPSGIPSGIPSGAGSITGRPGPSGVPSGSGAPLSSTDVGAQNVANFTAVASAPFANSSVAALTDAPAPTSAPVQLVTETSKSYAPLFPLCRSYRC